ncbi:unnamed protein product [Orchesella dallaii]|uniref:Gustatory receptor n=1 Tax=Orchesella dallaii TaxID=48710 RepID=A0ABP1RK00_9HEXA
MSTPLILFSYKLNQALCFPLFLNPVTWDNETEQWSYGKHRLKLIARFFISFGIIIPGVFFVCIMRFVANELNPGTQSAKEQIAFLFTAAFILYALCVEVILFKHGYEIVEVSSWEIQYEREQFQHTIENHKVSVKEEMKRILSGNIDPIGMFFVTFVTTIAISTILAPIILVLLDLDPLYFGLLGISKSTSINGYHLDDIKWARFVLLCTIFGFQVETMRSCTIWFIGIVLLTQKNIRLTCQKPVGKQSLFLYCQLRVMEAFACTIDGDISKLVFSTLFVTFITFTTVTVRGWPILSAYLVLFAAVASIATLAILMIGMNYLVNLYEISGAGIEKWKAELGLMPTNKRYITYLRKYLKSIKYISVPVGEIGIFDKDIKTNYFANTMDSTINSLLAY